MGSNMQHEAVPLLKFNLKKWAWSLGAFPWQTFQKGIVSKPEVRRTRTTLLRAEFFSSF
jgi:hypothetical protein